MLSLEITVKRYEYSMGHGQCPICTGIDPAKPALGGWPGVGHYRSCFLARLMKRANIPLVWYDNKRPKRVKR